MSVLIVAEKPSVAKEIAKIIGADKGTKGYKEGNNYIVSWCIGHLVELAEPDAYNPALKKWSLETLPIIPEQYKTVVSTKTAEQYKILAELINRPDVTELVCATDAGREGELIFRLVYNETGCNKPCKRLWISSMEEKSIRNGLANMKDSSEYDNLYKAAQCRQQADWLLGINFTRLYSRLYGRTLPTGRVQTPTISLIVNRQTDIDNFNPELYYNVYADLNTFIARTKVNDKKAAQEIVNRCTDREAVVTLVTEEDKKENPQALYDLTSLQRDANRILGYTAKQTLDVMQALYDAKLATYPRTDSRYITADMKSSTRSLIEQLINMGLYNNIMLQDYNLITTDVNKIVNDSKVTDHHAILPTSSLTKEKYDNLPTTEKNILTLVIFRLLTAVYPAHMYRATKAVLDIEGDAFEATGRVVLDKGYKAVEQHLKNCLILEVSKKNKTAEKDPADQENVLPPLAEGDTFAVQAITVEEKKTQPPKSYTEDSLLGAMETAGKNIADEELREAMKNSGLGTPATRAGIIENIINTGYIVRDKKNLQPTDQAKVFMDLVTSKLKSPELTAEWEKRLSEIQEGVYTDTAFMDEITGFIRSFISDYKLLHSEDEPKDNFFEKTEKKSVGTCPRCGKNIIEWDKVYSCESGKDGCGFSLWKKMCGKSISPTQAQKLLTKQKTDLIKGFTSKAGKSFNAYLIIKEDDKSIGFEFSN